MRPVWKAALCAASLCITASLALPSCLARGRNARIRIPVTPSADAVFTASRQVTALSIALDGTVWAGTSGGVLRLTTDGRCKKYTRADGLSSHEVRSIQAESDSVTAVFPTRIATLRGAVWQSESVPERPDASGALKNGLPAVKWRGNPYSASPSGLHVKEGTGWRLIGMPLTSGTHISVLVTTNEALLTAIYGDGIWSYNGRGWNLLNLDIPDEAREITAFATHPHTQTLTHPPIVLGTRRAGIWLLDGSRWVQRLHLDEPYDHNVQAAAYFQDNLYISTLEDGLVVKTDEGWRHIAAPAISSNAPRQMVEFRGRLYVRHGSGRVDTFDGERWLRDAFARLPRKQVSALSADSERLYAAQWGGWSEYDGDRWTSYLDLPELQGVPLTCLLPVGKTLWIGTQNRGLAEFSRATRTLRWHDERNGLNDDWITALAESGSRLYAGTFVGGLARLEGGAWRPITETSGQNVTALEPDGRGGIYAATRAGLWHVSGSDTPTCLRPRTPILDSELQALHKAPGGLWVGARTGFFFLSDKTLSDTHTAHTEPAARAESIPKSI